MTMTRDQIADLKQLYAAMTNCEMYGEDGAAKGVMVPQSLLDQFERALAERALEPQGQALPELPDPDIEGGIYNQTHKIMVRGPVNYSPKLTKEYGQQCYDAGRASQLALPGGPVPKGWRLVPEVPTLEMLRAMNDGFEDDDDGQDYDECYAQAWSGALVAAPKPNTPDVEIYQQVTVLPSVCDREALKEADALISRIEAFYDGADMFAWSKVREKVHAALASQSPAVAQPVADDLTSLANKMQNALDDPMWANHIELPKSVLKIWLKHLKNSLVLDLPQHSAIPRSLLGKIVDEVFDGACEDASVIEEIYAVIMREVQSGKNKGGAQ